MITKQQALTAREFHFGECTREPNGPKGGAGKVHQVRCRRNGATKVWKTRPDDFRVGVKHGMYEYARIVHIEGGESNAHQFHTADDCPLLKTED
jgi:hypothetical protein